MRASARWGGAACPACLSFRGPSPDALPPLLFPFSALPFLERTELFLYPIGAIALIAPLATLAGFNPSRFVLGIYFG